MIKRVKNILIWLFIMVYMTLVMGLVTSEKKKILCHSIHVNIKDSLEVGFLSQEDILSLIDKNAEKILGTPLGNINTSEIEKTLHQSSFIKNAEVFHDIEGNIHVDISQHMPVVRVINHKNESYYMDTEGNIMPLSGKYTARVMVANGHIKEPFDWKKFPNVLTQKGTEDKRNTLKEIYQVSLFIHQHELWKYQFEQLYVNAKGEFELIPKVGAHIIELGNFENYEQKFDNLYALYKKGLNSVGWNQYEKISLKYQNQVICTKR